MIPSIIILVLGAAMSVVFIVSKVINYSLKTIIFKTIASLFFVVLGILDFCLNPHGYFLFKLFTVLGLFFGMLGDLFLGFKYITTKTKNMWILLGMFAFLLGHLFYMVGLFIGFYVPGYVICLILPFVIPIFLIFIYLVIAKKIGIDFGKGMLPFAISYLFCLSSMVVTALCMACIHSFSLVTIVMFFVGSVHFAVSDCMLTGSYFRKGQRTKAYNAIYSVFYYIAQFVIAFSIFFLV